MMSLGSDSSLHCNATTLIVITLYCQNTNVSISNHTKPTKQKYQAFNYSAINNENLELDMIMLKLCKKNFITYV